MGDTWERVQLASARVPFRLKVAAVWVVLFAVLAFLGNAAGFDVQWIRDNFRYILGGLRYTMVIAVSGIVLAIVLALLGALARISSNPVAYAVAGFYVSFFRGTPLIVQMFLLYLALPPVGRNLAAEYGWLPEGFDQALVLDAATAGTHRARPQLRRLHDRDLPGRHPVGGRRPGRGGRRARHDVRPEDAQGGAAAGVPGDHPAHRQRVHRDDEGHRAGLVPGRHHRQRRGLPPVPARRQGRLQEPRGVRRRRARLLGPDRGVHVLPGPAGARIGRGYDRDHVARAMLAASEQGQPHGGGSAG